MSGVGALRFDSDSAERQGDVVDVDKHVLDGNLLLIEPLGNGVARQIHIRRWFEKHELSTFYTATRHRAVTLDGERNIGRLRKGIQYSKTYVVASVTVFATDVTQSDNKKLHNLDVMLLQFRQRLADRERHVSIVRSKRQRSWR